ncbi:hypothetical protein [Carboxylicivirga sp. RSCT41]|uniref:hypothetical protein n=1 Tax=Carboxylicivirga agarovorans TaxID=3417570 RepID=UPI003D359030
MNHRLRNTIIGFFLFIALSAILKFYFKTPNAYILFLAAMSATGGFAKILAFGLINPPSWLYQIRFSVIGIFYGAFIGILLFGMDTIGENTLIIPNLLKYLLIGALVGGVFNRSPRLKRRKGLFTLERLLVKDFAQLSKLNGESIKGTLVLTNEQLIFIGNKDEEKLFEKDIREINPSINKIKWLRIPDGFRIGNDEILLRVPFPHYWLKRIDKRQRQRLNNND